MVQEIINQTYPGLVNVSSISTTDLIKGLESYYETLEIIDWIARGADCYKINRFISAESEEVLEQKAKSLNDNSSFFAGKFKMLIAGHKHLDFNFLSNLGLVFMHPNGSYPTHIQYKIRMGKDAAPSTNSLKSQ